MPDGADRIMPASKRARTAILVILNAAIYFFIGKWLYENVRPAAIATHLAELPAWPVAAIVVVNMVAVVAYGRRMAYLLGRGFLDGWRVVILGLGMNSVLPFRLGEPAKIFYAYRHLGLSPLRVAEATFIEKYIDLICVAALFALTIAISAQHILEARFLWWTVAVIAAASIVILAFNKAVAALDRLVSGTGTLQALLQAAKTMGKGYPLRPVLATTAVIWLFNLGVIHFAFNALLPDATIRLVDALTLLVICALSVAIPAAPAGIGLFEAGIVAYLTQALSVPQEQALVVAVVFHLAVILPQLAIMLAVILRKRDARDGHAAAGSGEPRE